MSTVTIPVSRPWLLWTVAILTLLWNGSGAVTILLAQAGKLAGISADEAAYYAAQPLWLLQLIYANAMKKRGVLR